MVANLQTKTFQFQFEAALAGAVRPLPQPVHGAGHQEERQVQVMLRPHQISSITFWSRSGSSSGSGVRCIINLANWSMFTMLDVETNTECGRTNKDFPPRNVFPGYRCGVSSVINLEKSVRRSRREINELLWIFHPSRALHFSVPWFLFNNIVAR